MDLHGRTALVTGSARGIGQALCVALAERGCAVIGLDRDAQDETEAKVRAAGRGYTALTADLADEGAARAAAREAAGHGFDLLVNNAGVAPSGAYRAQPFEVWAATVRIDLLAPMAVTYECLPMLRSRPRAGIVNLSSIAGVSVTPGTAAYNAAKFGVTGFSRALAAECAGSSVFVSTIHPSMVRTRMTDGVTGSAAVPVIEVEAVVAAILRAVSREAHTVFVPGRMRLLTEALPALSPRLARRITARDAAARSWLQAAKRLPD